VTVRISNCRTLIALLLWFAYLLIFFGILGIAAYVWAGADRMVYQQIQQQRFESARVEITSGVPSKAPPQLSRAKPERLIIGELLIPRLGIQSVIQEGIGASVLRRSVGHIPETPLPGDPGNAVLAGHRDTIFRPLERVERGDRVMIRSRDATFEFQVDSITIVSEDATEVLRDTPGKARLTLVTCYPFEFAGRAARRLIVMAKLESHGETQAR
jgi:sortase A